MAMSAVPQPGESRDAVCRSSPRRGRRRSRRARPTWVLTKHLLLRRAALTLLRASFHPSPCVVAIAVLVLFLRLVQQPALGARDAGGEFVGLVGLREGVLLGDQLVLPMVVQRVVQQNHAVLGARLDRRRDAERLVLADQVGDG